MKAVGVGGTQTYVGAWGASPETAFPWGSTLVPQTSPSESPLQPPRKAPPSLPLGSSPVFAPPDR